jgi:hypothetical protein
MRNVPYNATVTNNVMGGKLVAPIPLEDVCRALPGAQVKRREARATVDGVRFHITANGSIVAINESQNRIHETTASVLAIIGGALREPMRILNVVGTVKFERRLDKNLLPGEARQGFPGKLLQFGRASVALFGKGTACIAGAQNVDNFLDVAQRVATLIHEAGALLREPAEELADELQGLNVEPNMELE